MSLSESAGFSKFGVDLKVSAPRLFMEKSEASGPPSLQLTLPAFGPNAEYSATLSLPFSG